MQRTAEGLLLSATDLARGLACRHATELERALAEGRRAGPTGFDPQLALLQARGLAHEQAYLEHLRQHGLEVVELGDEADSANLLGVLRRGAGAVVQAPLAAGRWRGRADVLLRVEEPSALGAFSYEAVETKLAQRTRGGTVLQLALYSDLLGELLGREPERMHVVRPENDFALESFRVADFRAYYRFVRGRFEAIVAAPPTETYPRPVAHCDVCRWWQDCDRRRHQDDHLCLVAGLRANQIDELERQGFATLEGWAESPTALVETPRRGHRDGYARAHGQARIQLRGRREGAPRHELLPVEPGHGLSALPAPSPGDLFFDFEGDPFVPGGGLEYLLGVVAPDAHGQLEHHAFWALDRKAEKSAFEAFVDFVKARREAWPDLHLYHFSPYEPAALQRLMSRHGTRETEIDDLLRGERFVDLLAVTRRGLRASVERYSLKALEPFSDYVRSVDLPAAGTALRRVAAALTFGTVSELTAADRERVANYNRDDCLSTRALRDWLEERRTELVASGAALERPPLEQGAASAEVAERDAQVQEVFAALVAPLPADRGEWGPAEHARWLLAHLLGYLRREDKCAWWDFFRLHDLDFEEQLAERKTVAGLEFVGEVAGGTAQCPVHRYRFPPQEVAVDEGDPLHEVGGESVGSAHALDRVRGLLDIKKAKAARAVHPAAVLVFERVQPQPIDEALLALGRFVAEHGFEGTGPFRAARDLLLRYGPRRRETGPLRAADESSLEAARRLVLALDGGVLALQGPPGSGKTYTGARLIVELAKQGRRVGVTAVSHKVIRNLLEAALEAAREDGFELAAVAKVSEKSSAVTEGLTEATSLDVQAELAAGKIVGGTTWLWAREEWAEALNVLFVDEAGQQSLAHALAAARSARNLVLLGDPQQLEQPQRGAHPEGAEVAALVHWLDGHPTMPLDRGLFLDVTWRLAPRICAFTSELFYEGRLQPRPELASQRLTGPPPYAGSGLFFVPVAHTGNSSHAPEEVEEIAQLVATLCAPGVTWADAQGAVRPVTLEDVLVVAPYNAQVQALLGRLPAGARVGTVDKFQGQEAPVVIYSLTSSSAEDAPRGKSFLYNPNRLNVATSRARAACFVVGAPRLFEPECHTPEEMRWVNAFCRLRELAVELPPPGHRSEP
ncbi:MAG: TM0106 family RecB-like putative nuclease [Thermoanaerobaculia bacterium]|nr:TM0106 family RecB-like putative nuclease [Thermoanaerobaculia bacterium]